MPTLMIFGDLKLTLLDYSIDKNLKGIQNEIPYQDALSFRFSRGIRKNS